MPKTTSKPHMRIVNCESSKYPAEKIRIVEPSETSHGRLLNSKRRTDTTLRSSIGRNDAQMRLLLRFDKYAIRQTVATVFPECGVTDHRNSLLTAGRLFVLLAVCTLGGCQKVVQPGFHSIKEAVDRSV